MYDGTEGTFDVIMISYIISRKGLLHYFLPIMLTSKHVLGTYMFANISKHVFKIRICLLRT